MSRLFESENVSQGYSGLVQAQPYPLLLAIILGTLIIRHWLYSLPKTANFPVLNPAEGIDLVGRARHRDWMANGLQLLQKGEMANPNRPFNMMTGSGMMTILPPLMAHSLRSDPELDFLGFISEDNHAHLPGFEVFGALGEEKMILAVINKHLTKHLNKVTQPLSSEASYAMEVNFGSANEWQPVAAYSKMLDVVARMSSRMFLGEELCRDADWLEVTKHYTLQVVVAGNLLREYPSWLRPLVNRVLPKFRELKALSTHAKKIMDPVIRKRQLMCKEAVQNGEPMPRFEDAISWFEDEATDSKSDPATVQLMLSFVAIHTTTDLLTETLLQLSQRPQLVEELRNEISTVLRDQGLQKQALYSMKLLDSVIKEAQRMKPITLVSMTRRAMTDIKLPTGEVIPKGAVIACSTSLHQDPDHYDDPLTFKGDRFLKWRDTDRSSASNLVSTGPASLGFGHGMHACAGRFFAANEIKVALCHLLMKYDWQLAPNESTDPMVHGFAQTANPMAKVLVRKRAEIELDIDSLH